MQRLCVHVAWLTSRSCIICGVLDVESLYQLEARVRVCFEAEVVATGSAHEAIQVCPRCTDLVYDSWLAAACRVAITCGAKEHSVTAAGGVV